MKGVFWNGRSKRAAATPAAVRPIQSHVFSLILAIFFPSSRQRRSRRRPGRACDRSGGIAERAQSRIDGNCCRQLLRRMRPERVSGRRGPPVHRITHRRADPRGPNLTIFPKLTHGRRRPARKNSSISNHRTVRPVPSRKPDAPRSGRSPAALPPASGRGHGPCSGSIVRGPVGGNRLDSRGP